jgi:glutamyl-tRNA reductase
MNLLVVGASFRTAPVETLERLAIPAEEVPLFARRLLAGRYVTEAIVMSTCNRIEVYAAVSGFHGGLSDIAAELAAQAGTSIEDISGHLYVRHESQAVQHAFSVAAGMDSLVVGEAQILGQLRDAYQVAREAGTVSRLLHELMQQALRVGKRVHAEANVDEAAPSVVSAALDVGAQARPGGLAGADVLVVGAGAMGGLALSALRRRDAGRLVIANRDAAKAQRLAEAYQAEPLSISELDEVIPSVDVIVSATGSVGPVIHAAMLSGRRQRLLICDLAVPRDVAGDVAALPGVTVVDIETLTRNGQSAAGAAFLAAAERILAEEIEAFAGVARAAQVAPTVAALRTRAGEVVDAELSRLRRRTPELSDDQRAEVAHTVHRVVRQLLHQPTVRVRQLASEPGGESYAEALRELFALDSPQLNAVEGGGAAEALRVTPPDVDDRGAYLPHWT